MTTESSRGSSERITALCHENCVVCGPSNDRGLHVQFALLPDGSTRASFDCDKTFEGYPDRLHGGVISALLDGAMTHCIFAQGHMGVTAELKVRYRHPVITGRIAVLSGRIRESRPPLYLMAAELLQDGQVKVTATAKFLALPQSVDKGYDTLA